VTAKKKGSGIAIFKSKYNTPSSGGGEVGIMSCAPDIRSARSAPNLYSGLRNVVP